MQRTGAGPLAQRVLIVDSGLAEPSSAAVRSVRALQVELRARSLEVIEATSYEDGLATVASDSGIHCILLNWTAGLNDNNSHAQATELLRAVRKRNAKLPIFLMASRNLAGSVSAEVATLADEFIWILDDTASFVSGRVQASVERYIANLLPPYAAALARYDREREYSWAAPWPSRRRCISEIAGRPRLLRLLRRKPVSHRHGHRTRCARLDAWTQRPCRRERAFCGQGFRRSPFLHGNQWHLRVESRNHVGQCR